MHGKINAVNLNSDELYCYQFIISLDRYDNSCYTGENPFDRICVSKKTKTVTLEVFDMIKVINESRTFINLISSECRCEFDGRKFNLKQIWNNEKC